MKEPGNHRQGQVSHLPISVASISSQPVAGEQEKAVKLRLLGVAVWGTMTTRSVSLLLWELDTAEDLSHFCLLGKKPALELTGLVLEQVQGVGPIGEPGRHPDESSPPEAGAKDLSFRRHRQGWHRLAASPYRPARRYFLWQETGPRDSESLLSPDGPEETFVRRKGPLLLQQCLGEKGRGNTKPKILI